MEIEFQKMKMKVYRGNNEVSEHNASALGRNGLAPSLSMNDMTAVKVGILQESSLLNIAYFPTGRVQGCMGG